MPTSCEIDGASGGGCDASLGDLIRFLTSPFALGIAVAVALAVWVHRAGQSEERRQQTVQQLVDEAIRDRDAAAMQYRETTKEKFEAEQLQRRKHDEGAEQSEPAVGQFIELLLLAAREDRVIVSGDTDFGTLLAMSRGTSPSVILFCSRNALTAEQHAELILSHLDNLTPELSEGAVVVVSDDRIRIRRLPLLHDT